MKTDKWVGFNFNRNGWSLTHENRNTAFEQFGRDFRSDLKAMLKGTGWEVVKLGVNYFYVSGFLYNASKGRFIYISCSDVRYFQDEWSDNLLVRTAKDSSDYTGGQNRFCSFVNLPEMLDKNW